MEKMSDLELARQAFLLVVCERGDENGPEVNREYLAEKVNAIYRARHVWEIVALLDLSGQRRFTRIAKGLGLE